MAKLKHDSDGFLVGERADLGSETQLLEKISKDIAAIRAALSGNADSITASPQVQQAMPVEVSRTENNNNNHDVIRENSRIVEVNPRLNQAQRSGRSENINQRENRVDSSNNRVLLASLETASNNLHDVHIDLSSMQNSLVNQSASNNSVVNSRSASVLNSQSNEENNNERKEHRQSSHSNVAFNDDIRGINSVQQQGGQSTRTSSSSNAGLQENNTNRNYVAEPSIRERDSNGRFIRKDKAESSEPKREVASPKGRDSNGRFTSGGGLGSGRGGEEGFISRLADRVGSAVGNTVSGDAVDEKFDPTVAAFKEAAEPIAKTFQFAGKLGGGVFNTLKTAVDFVPKIGGNDKAEKTENSVSRNESATNTVLTANQTENSRISSTNNELSHSVNVENANLRNNVNASGILTNSNENNELRNNVNVAGITHNGGNSSQNTTNSSPASREVRTLPDRINETTTANPTLRVRDNRGRFVSANQPSAQTSTRQTGSSLIQNNVSQSRVIEPSRNTITSTNSVNSVSQSTENAAQSIQSESPVAETSQRGFFSRGNDSINPKEKGGKLSLRGAIKEIIASRKEQSIYNKASLKLLKAIAGQETTVSGSGSSSGGFLSGLMGGLIPMVVAGLGALVAGVVGVFTGIGGMLLAGVTGALGVIFSPIGLAIAAAGALAWGLFTEDGQKFFASIGEYISKGWDGAIGFIKDTFPEATAKAIEMWDSLKKEFEPITKLATDLFDGLTKTWKEITDTISGIFDSFSTFLKDKFGIDIPAIVSTIVQPVEKAANAVVDSVKNTAGKVWDGAKNVAGNAVEDAKNVVNPAYEGVKKSVKDGTVLKDTTTGVKGVAGKVADGAGDVYEKVKDTVTGNTADEKAKVVMKTLMDEGFTKEQAAGMAGNFNVESGGFSDRVLSGKKRGDGGKAVGLLQWHKERSDPIEAHFGKKIGEMSLEEQTKAAVWEMKEKKGDNESRAYKKIKATTTAEEAAAVTDKYLERSSGEATKERMNVAGHFNKLDLSTVRKKPADTQIASSKSPSTANLPIETETALEKLSPISTAAASETPANGGKVAPEIAAQAKGKDYFLGDSIAHGYRGKGEGDTVVGRNPAKILESMQKNLAENPDFYKGKNVHLSTGMSNNTGDTKSIEAQMKLLKESGANASVYGVSNNFKGDTKAAAGYNKTLADLSAKYGLNFTGGFEASKDTVHPKSYSNDPSKNAAAQKSVEAGLKSEVLEKVNQPAVTVDKSISAENSTVTNSNKNSENVTLSASSIQPIESTATARQSDAISQYAKTGKFTPTRNNYGDGSDLTAEQMASVAKYQGGDVSSNQSVNNIQENSGIKSNNSVDSNVGGSTSTARYSFQDIGDGQMTMTDIKTGISQLATSEQVENYKSGQITDNSSSTTQNVSVSTESSNPVSVSSDNVAYNETTSNLNKSDALKAQNTPEAITVRKVEGEKYRDPNRTGVYKNTTENTAIENKSVEVATTEGQAAQDIKPRVTPKSDIAATLAKNSASSIPNLASTVIGNAGGIGESLMGKLPAFLSNPASAITASVAAPSVPKIPSIPAVSDPPVIKEPLNTNNDSRQQSAASYPQSEVGQDISDKRLAHIVSGGYARGG